MTTVITIGHVKRREGSGLWAEPKAHTAPERIPRSGGRSVKGRTSRSQAFTAVPASRACPPPPRSDLERGNAAHETCLNAFANRDRGGLRVVSRRRRGRSPRSLREKPPASTARARRAAATRTPTRRGPSLQRPESGERSGGRHGARSPPAALAGTRAVSGILLRKAFPLRSRECPRAPASARRTRPPAPPRTRKRSGRDSSRDVGRSPRPRSLAPRRGSLHAVSPLRRRRRHGEEEPEKPVRRPPPVGENQEARDRSGDRPRPGDEPAADVTTARRRSPRGTARTPPRSGVEGRQRRLGPSAERDENERCRDRGDEVVVDSGAHRLQETRTRRPRRRGGSLRPVRAVARTRIGTRGWRPSRRRPVRGQADSQCFDPGSGRVAAPTSCPARAAGGIAESHHAQPPPRSPGSDPACRRTSTSTAAAYATSRRQTAVGDRGRARDLTAA